MYLCSMAYKFTKIKSNPIELPCRKKMYNSPEEAQDMIQYIKESRQVREIKVYRCTICGFWHLTSKSGQF
jgi:hypothetical protein